MITIIFAPPRTGKTCLMTHISNMMMYDYERNRKMKNEIMQKIANGFWLSMPMHCVNSNYDIFGRKYGYSRRASYRFNPFKIGFWNRFVKVGLTVPWGLYAVTEAQMYFNSRMSMYYPDWQSRWMEQHGHNNLDILLDTQRPMLIDVNIRELANFIEIIKLDKHYDEFGKIKKLVWHIRKIDNSFLFYKYMASGKTDKSCYTKETITADYNVFECYDSQNCKPKFYEGHFDEDFDLNEAKPIEESIDGYKKYLSDTDDKLPPGFYQKRSVNNGV